MSLSRWRKLSDADKQLVKSAAKRSVPVMRQMWQARVSEARTRLITAGIEANEVDDLSAFQARMEPVWERFITTEEQKDLVARTIEIGEDLEARS